MIRLKKVENRNTGPVFFLDFPLLIEFSFTISTCPTSTTCPCVSKYVEPPSQLLGLSSLPCGIGSSIPFLRWGDVRLRNWANRMCLTLRKKHFDKPFKKNRCSFQVNFGLGVKNLNLLRTWSSFLRRHFKLLSQGVFKGIR